MRRVAARCINLPAMGGIRAILRIYHSRMSKAKVEEFIKGADALNRLLSPLSREDLLSHPVPGTWSLQTLIIHIMDSDLIATHRMKRIIAEENPLLISYDENAFAKSLFYDSLDASLAAETFRVNRLQMGEILRQVDDSTFARCGIHNQRGKVTLGEFVDLYVHHVEHHFVFARAKLKALGKPIHI